MGPSIRTTRRPSTADQKDAAAPATDGMIETAPPSTTLLLNDWRALRRPQRWRRAQPSARQISSLLLRRVTRIRLRWRRTTSAIATRVKGALAAASPQRTSRAAVICSRFEVSYRKTPASGTGARDIRFPCLQRPQARRRVFAYVLFAWRRLQLARCRWQLTATHFSQYPLIRSARSLTPGVVQLFRSRRYHRCDGREASARVEIHARPSGNLRDDLLGGGISAGSLAIGTGNLQLNDAIAATTTSRRKRRRFQYAVVFGAAMQRLTDNLHYLAVVFADQNLDSVAGVRAAVRTRCVHMHKVKGLAMPAFSARRSCAMRCPHAAGSRTHKCLRFSTAAAYASTKTNFYRVKTTSTCTAPASDSMSKSSMDLRCAAAWHGPLVPLMSATSTIQGRKVGFNS